MQDFAGVDAACEDEEDEEADEEEEGEGDGEEERDWLESEMCW